MQVAVKLEKHISQRLRGGMCMDRDGNSLRIRTTSYIDLGTRICTTACGCVAGRVPDRTDSTTDNAVQSWQQHRMIIDTVAKRARRGLESAEEGAWRQGGRQRQFSRKRQCPGQLWQF